MHNLMFTSCPSLLSGATPATSDASHLQLLSQFQLLYGQRALIKIYKMDPKSPAVHQAIHLPLLQYPPGPSDPARDQASAQRCSSTLPQLTCFPLKIIQSPLVWQSPSPSPQSLSEQEAAQDTTVHTPHSSWCRVVLKQYWGSSCCPNTATLSVSHSPDLPSSPPCRDQLLKKPQQPLAQSLTDTPSCLQLPSLLTLRSILHLLQHPVCHSP